MQVELETKIINVDVERIRPLRHAELRQGQDFSTTSYLRDHDEDTFHMACMVNSKVVTCATFYPELLSIPLSTKKNFMIKGSQFIVFMLRLDKKLQQ